jgi:transposase
MKTLSLDLRERLLTAYDQDQGTREEVARRFRVSLGMVKKLLQQRRKTGDIRPRHRFAGRKPRLLPAYGQRLGALVARQPDLTLVELRDRLGMPCSVPAVHQVLTLLGLTYKKRRSMPQNRTGPMSRGRGAAGDGSKEVSIPPGSSSSTSRRPRRT